jgi:hypothetical protein
VSHRPSPPQCSRAGRRWGHNVQHLTPSWPRSGGNAGMGHHARPPAIVHSDSQSAIARLAHIGPGPGQSMAQDVFHSMLQGQQQGSRVARLTSVKGHAGTPGNERNDALAFTKLKVSEGYNEAKAAWSAAPGSWGAEEITPKKSCADRARNSVAQVASQIRTGHWRSAVFLKRIRRRRTDQCWFCST